MTRASLLRDECHEFVTRFFINGHPYHALFLAIGSSISSQTLNKYCEVVGYILLLAFLLKKVMHNNKINSAEKMYDVNWLYIQYLSK